MEKYFMQLILAKVNEKCKLTQIVKKKVVWLKIQYEALSL